MKKNKQVSKATASDGQPKRRAGRPDPLGEIWDKVAISWLESAPDLPAYFIYQRLLEEFPQLPENIRRTVERRVNLFRALKGLPKEVMFPQKAFPGRLGISDFTTMSRHGIKVEGDLLDHLLYHFRLPWSSYEYACIVLGGESFVSLSTGLQDALYDLGGVPHFHRTDSLSAAFRNLSREAEEDLTRRYAEVCKDFGMQPTRNNRGVAHENGAIESAHGHLHRAISAELSFRGSVNFPDLTIYRAFIADIVERRNARHAKKIDQERAHLLPLPKQRSIDYEETFSRVTSSSAITVRRVFYTVPSRLIGQLLRVRIYDDRLDCYLSDKLVYTVARGQRGAGGQLGYQIDYRHIIHSLRNKPGALLNLSYRDQLFPQPVYREIFEFALTQLRDDRQACRFAVDLLSLAHERNCENELAAVLKDNLDRGELPKLSELRGRFHSTLESLPTMMIELPSLTDYDSMVLEHCSQSKENNND